MSVNLASIPNTPFNVAVQPVLNSIVPLTSGVTLTNPSSATLITGASVQVTVPNLAQFIAVYFQGSDATVTAAATITTALYKGATSGALTTLVGNSVVVAPTGGTTVAVNSIFWIPVTTDMYGTSFFVSVAATASSGNYVLNAGSTSPTNLIAVVY